MDVTTGTILMIVCYVFGSGLLILEAFMPGFGVAGIAGVIMEIVAIVLTNQYFGLAWSLIATFAVLLFVGVIVFLSYRSAMKGRLSKSALILKNTEKPKSSANALSAWVGREGVTVSSLRPAGFIEIDGTRLSAATSGEFLSKGTSVQVTGTEGDHLVIRRA